MLWVAEAIRKPVERTGRRDCLSRLAPVHDVHEVCLNPALEDIPVLAEPREPLRVLEELVHKSLDREVEAPFEAARESAMRQAGKQRCQHAVHFELFEVKVGQLLGIERAVFTRKAHQRTSSGVFTVASIASLDSTA